MLPLELDILADGWPMVVWCPLEVTRPTGEVDHYQLVLAMHRVAAPAIDPSALIGVVAAPAGTTHVYDALADPESSPIFGAVVAPDIDLRSPRTEPGDATSSCVVFDDRWELRVYRRLLDGPNPDVEVPLALRRLGVEDVPTPIAVWQRAEWDLAMVRRRLRRATSGDELARASVLEMLERRCPPRSAPADFRAPAEALGAALARVHVGMAGSFGTEPATGKDLADALVARARRLLESPAELARIERSYRRLDGVADVGGSMRIHGDLQLDRAAMDRRGWSFVDFSADPDLPAPERRAWSSPLRDVAAMLQSLHVVAADARSRHRESAGGDDVRSAEQEAEADVLVEAWEERAAKAFVSGYTSVDAVHQLLPADRPARDALLAVFELSASIEQYARRSAEPVTDEEGAIVIPLRAEHHPHRW